MKTNYNIPLKKYNINIVNRYGLCGHIKCHTFTKNNVFIFDKDTNKIDDIKNKKSPIEDQDVQEYLENKNLKLNFSYNLKDAISNVEFIVLALPTNYDETLNSFDASILENVIKEIFEINKNSTLVIKSTIPVGFVESLSTKFQLIILFFTRIFKRRAYMITCIPRIIIGSHSANGKSQIYLKHH